MYCMFLIRLRDRREVGRHASSLPQLQAVNGAGLTGVFPPLTVISSQLGLDWAIGSIVGGYVYHIVVLLVVLIVGINEHIWSSKL